MRTGWMQKAAGATMAGALLLAAALPVGASERPDTDPRWQAWLGCWTPDGGGENHLLCVRPMADDAAVRLVTYAEGGRVVSDETVRADGQQRPVAREGCNGWESAQFSKDNRRVYVRSEFACEGDVRRSSSGLISMASPTMWLDVQTVGVEGQSAVRVVRYRLAAPEVLEAAGVEPVALDRAMAVNSARTAVSAPLTVDAVIDASQHVSPEAVEAWIVERGDRFALNADALVEMADAGVPESVIDLTVAVSYPGTFAVNGEQMQGEFAATEEVERSRPDHYAYPGYYDPFYWDPFRYSRYGGYYSPYGYGRYGWYSPGYYNPVIVVVSPDDNDSASPPGRVVRGRGYTRGGRTVSEPSSSGSYRSPPSSSSGTATRSTTGSSTGSASTGSSTQRRAKPRGGSSGTGTGGH